MGCSRIEPAIVDQPIPRIAEVLQKPNIDPTVGLDSILPALPNRSVVKVLCSKRIELVRNVLERDASFQDSALRPSPVCTRLVVEACVEVNALRRVDDHERGFGLVPSQTVYLRRSLRVRRFANVDNRRCGDLRRGSKAEGVDTAEASSNPAALAGLGCTPKDVRMLQSFVPAVRTEERGRLLVAKEAD